MRGKLLSLSSENHACVVRRRGVDGPCLIDLVVIDLPGVVVDASGILDILDIPGVLDIVIDLVVIDLPGVVVVDASGILDIPGVLDIVIDLVVIDLPGVVVDASGILDILDIPGVLDIDLVITPSLVTSAATALGLNAVFFSLKR